MTSEGRADLVIKTNMYIYVMGFKYNKNAQIALKQINKKNYVLPFAVDGRKVIKIGCNFSSRTCTLNDWIIEQ